MPRFIFTSAQPLTYPESRDALGQLLRTVNPGDEREFDTPPDHHWTPAGDGLHEHPGFGGEMHGTEHPADGTMSPPVSNPGGDQDDPDGTGTTGD